VRLAPQGDFDMNKHTRTEAIDAFGRDLEPYEVRGDMA
jgi:hypothetical protein